MLLVHHRLADLELREVAQHAFDRAALLRGAAAPAHHARVELGLGDHRPALGRQDKALGDRRHAEHAAGGFLNEVREARAGVGLQAVFGEVARHRLAPAGRFGGEQHAHAGGLEEALQGGERVLRAAVHRERGKGDGLQGLRARVLGLVHDIQAGEGLRAYVELLGGNEELGGGEQRPVGVAARHLVARVRVAPELLDRLADVMVQGERAARGQVVEQRRDAVEEKRQVVLDARRRHAVGDVAVQALLRRIAFEQLAPAATEARAPGVVQRELARRQHAQLLHRVERALRVDVEGLDRVDHVVVQVERCGSASPSEQIDQPPAPADLAGRDHLRDVLVTRDGELLPQFFKRQAFPRLEEERMAGEVGGRTQAHQRGRRRHHRDVELRALDAIERRQALRDQVLVRGELVVGQRFPVRQQAHAQLGREPPDLVHQALRVERGRGNDRERRFRLRQAAERERVGGAGEAGVASAGGKRIAVHQKGDLCNYIVLN
jgi:hypothetical protein